MRKISNFAVKYPVTVLMLMLGILLIGYISYGRLGIDLFPKFNNPALHVKLQAGEMPPEEIEKRFVEAMEGIALRQSGVTGVQAVCKSGLAQMKVAYQWEKDMDEAFLDLQKGMSSLERNELVESLEISQYDPNAQPILRYALTSHKTKDLDELRKVAENYIRNELIRLEGIADVQLTGAKVKEAVVITDPDRLEAVGISADLIVKKIKEYNRNVSGGTIEEKGRRYLVKGVSVFRTPKDLEDIVLRYTKAENSEERVPLHLRDVAEVQYQFANSANLARIEGEPCISLAIYKEPQFNTIKAVGNVESKLEEMSTGLSAYSFKLIENQGKFIEHAIGEVQETALIGMLLAVIVLFVFLRRFSTTMIVSIAIPLSVIATFSLMYFGKLTLNIMTLGGLALGAGMLVDNAIIVVENIMRLLDKGLSVKEAAVKGTAEMGGPIIASTLTTIVVFLPIVYLQGATGELFKDQAWTVAFSLLSSLLVAILVIPVLVVYFFPENKKTAGKGGRSAAVYGNLLARMLPYRNTVVLAGLVLTVASYFLIPVIGSEYFPTASSNILTVKMQMQEGTELGKTQEVLAQVEQMIRSVGGEDIDFIYSQGGETAWAEGSELQGSHTAELKIVLKKEAGLKAEELMASLDRNFSHQDQIRFSYSSEESALSAAIGSGDSPVVVEVYSKDQETIEQAAEQLADKLSGIDGILNVRTSSEAGVPEVEVSVDRVRAGMNQVTPAAVLSQVKHMLNRPGAGSFEYQGESKDIRLLMPDINRMRLKDLKINNSAKQAVSLSDVASFRETFSPKSILRKNQRRFGEVIAQREKGIPYDKLMKSVRKAIDELELPAGVGIIVGGQEAKRQESVEMMLFALLLSVVLVYMVMASQFESLVHPFTILFTIPLAMVGSLWAFLIAGTPISVMGFIGIIMLAGIAVNDSIILVDTINQLKWKGVELREAIVQAGKQRLRPIVMTSLTTILALTPMLIGYGEEAALRKPMALAVIGGLVTSTLLTLIVIPCAYAVVERAMSRLGLGQKAPQTQEWETTEA
ncbi:MAG: efflux RND transporter permease subunit [Cytophagales bacterium]|nr:efflux RND transporter permease subunit [Cytophagales bacterium]